MARVGGPRRAVISLLSKLLLAALLCVACAGVLGIEEATCSDEFSGCPGFEPGDGEGDAGAADEDAGEVDLCDEYCGEITENCFDENEQYTSYDFCMGVCAHLPPGEPGDNNNNTVQCRLLRARAANEGETEGSCQVAGPGSNTDGTCGTPCENYCYLMFEVCPEEVSTMEDCLDECADLDDVGFYTSQITKGQDLQCRIYHVNAATGDPVFHCPHAAGAGPCDMPRD